MKKLLLSAGLSIMLFGYSNAQVFWHENWTGGSGAQGTTTYTGPNGAWTVAATGTNGAGANVWYFSFTESAMGRDSCGTSSGTHATAHIGNVATSPNAHIYCPAGDCKAWADIGSGAPSDRTNKMLESPVINCSTRTGISFSFNYLMSHHIADVEYYDGSAWAVLTNPATTIVAPCFSNGLWTHYSVTLPVSADNNANVQIGFKWSNDTNNYDTISFAVDSIALSGAISSAVKALGTYNKDFNVYPNPNNGLFTIESSDVSDNSVIEVYNVIGEKVFIGNLNSAQNGSTVDLRNQPSGIYLYKVFSHEGTLEGIGKIMVQK